MADRNRLSRVGREMPEHFVDSFQPVRQHRHLGRRPCSAGEPPLSGICSGARRHWRGVGSASMLMMFFVWTSPVMVGAMTRVAAEMSPPTQTSVDDSDGGDWSERPDSVREVRYDEGESVDGDRLGPMGERVVAGSSLRHQSLISPRTDFVDRLMRFAHDM